MRHRYFGPFLLILISLGVAALIFINRGQVLKLPYQKEYFLMDTVFTLKLYGLSERQTEKVSDRVFESVKKVEKMISPYIPQSSLSRLNSGSEPGTDKELYEPLQAAFKIAALTEGYFSPVLGRVIRLYRFDGQPRVPPEKELAAALAMSDYKKVAFGTGFKIELKSGQLLDPGGFGKGYALDVAASVLEKEKVPGGLLTAGSSTLVWGKKTEGNVWKIGIEHPRKSDKLIGEINTVETGFISTSGDYQRYFIYRGKRYHHILDPYSGYPAEGFQSLTVLSRKSGLESDALSTGIFAMGKERGWDFVLKNKIMAVAVDSNGKVLVSPAIKDKFTPNR